MAPYQINRKKKAVADGVFKAELHEFLGSMLRENGFTGVDVKITPVKTYIIIKATRSRDVLGQGGRNLRVLSLLLQKRFGFKPNEIELLAERIKNRGLSAMAQAESLRFKLLKGLPVRRACYSIIRTVMEANAKGCEIAVSGKLRAQRAKTMKFKDGYIISKGHPASLYVHQAVRTVPMKQGILGVKVKIMLPYDPRGIDGPSIPLPDTVVVYKPRSTSKDNEKVHVDYFPKNNEQVNTTMYEAGAVA